VQRFDAAHVTLLDANDRMVFTGSALGMQGADSGWSPPGGAQAYKATLADWRSRTDGRYDILYTSRNHQWYTSPSYVDQLAQALDRASAGGSATIDSKLRPGLKLVKSDGAADVVASVGLP
jgi:glyoxylase-like metal-dependent hydrolase (beta-lactamase superfamily II)